LRIQGFIVFDYYAEAEKGRAVLRRAIEEGKLRLDTDSQTLCPARFEDIPAMFLNHYF
jgi:NADPH-dependent curcumin reductase CurA